MFFVMMSGVILGLQQKIRGRAPGRLVQLRTQSDSDRSGALPGDKDDDASISVSVFLLWLLKKVSSVPSFVSFS
ncbi:hypothetical protein COCNU_02G002590 [Cocos nucifera]|uniref:Uncharacterized protein n=1 Tax=Cocos nucifera TaxID=13894 RepID=A0A8K0MW41_COCNU|nr:hypothetical protein COCNU_02G002590 [Cocos nucifera]